MRSLADEVPFDIPDSWEWVTLQTIATSSLGKTPDKAKNEGGLPSFGRAFVLRCSRRTFQQLFRRDFIELCKGNQIGGIGVAGARFP